MNNTLMTSPFRAITGRATRRQLLRNAAALGVGAGVFDALTSRGAFASVDESLTVAVDGWIPAVHPPFIDVDADFAATFPLTPFTPQFSFDLMFADAAQEKSIWDAWIGATPFFDLVSLVESGAIEPWDAYLPAGLLDDFSPAIRAEGTYDGKFYVWPVLLDAVVQSWNAAILEKAGLDPDQLPTDWDAFIANATRVQSSGAATYGCSFDVTPWRSLIPIALSLSADVFREDGTFAWSGDAAVQALEIMRQMVELAQPGAGGADTFMDPGPFFELEDSGALVSYGTPGVIATATWGDPSKLRIASLPTTPERGGGSVFWNTGAVLFTYGQHKSEAVTYLQASTLDQRVWQHSLVGDPAANVDPVGQMPASASIQAEYETNPPAWLADSSWAMDLLSAAKIATSIPPTKLGFDQFVIALPFYTAYLTGEETDAKTALQKAEDAVSAEMAK